MEGEGGDPSSVNKNPRIIKAAQEEVSSLDVLVCGTCHYVFHFIEAFQEHKTANECGKPTFKANLSESKPQVWAFLLWKSSVMNQHKAEGEKEPINSWKLYQRWCKMADNIRESWISAGKSIQTFSTLGNAKIAEVLHINKPVEVSNDTKPRVTTKPTSMTDDEEDELAGSEGDLKMKQGKIRRIIRIPVEKNGNVRDAHMNVKEIRTYPTKKELSNEVSGKPDVNESGPVICNEIGGGGDAKDVSLESEDKENVKDPIGETTEPSNKDTDDVEKNLGRNHKTNSVSNAVVDETIEIVKIESPDWCDIIQDEDENCNKSFESEIMSDDDLTTATPKQIQSSSRVSSLLDTAPLSSKKRKYPENFKEASYKLQKDIHQRKCAILDADFKIKRRTLQLLDLDMKLKHVELEIKMKELQKLNSDKQ